MVERLALTFGLAALLAVAIAAVRLYARRRTNSLKQTPGNAMLARLGARADGRPTIVAFSTPSCAACYTAQAPAVASVAKQVGNQKVRVVHINAAHQPEIARAFGIMTVPSTVVLDPTGKVTAVNHGFAPGQRLVSQLQSA
jgi:thiol-disulfide isomerase/thioredoxin